MSDLTVNDLFAEEHIVLRLTPDDYRALLLVRYLAIEALCMRYGPRWPHYALAHDLYFQFFDRLECEVADQKSDVWSKVEAEGWRA